MKIIIVGCGRVGSRIALKLRAEGHDVTVVDRDPEAFEHLGNCSEIKAVLGTGIDEDVLTEAGITDADALISVAKGDNTNIMIAQMAKFIYKIPNVIARIVDPKSKKFFQDEFGFKCYCPTEISSYHYINLLKGVDEICML